MKHPGSTRISSVRDGKLISEGWIVAEHVVSELKYHRAHQPGEAIFCDGVCVQKGVHTDEQIEAIIACYFA